MGALGIFASIFARKFDQMAAITNFLITPLAFLSGTFYSVDALPPVLRNFTHANPIFYLIDGARYGILGVSDADPVFGIVFVSIWVVGIIAVCWWFFRSGYRLKP